VALLSILSFVRFAGASEDKLSKDDKEIIKDAMRNLQAVSDQSRVARERTENERVGHLARVIVGGDNKLIEQLRELGNKYNFGYDADPTKSDVKEGKELNKEKGKHFDREYVDNMIKQHEELLGIFKRGAKSDNKEVSDWFDKKQAAIREYLDQAQVAAKELKD
jgi:putative membrane protein